MFNAADRVMISSFFNIDALRKVREIDEDITLGLLVGEESVVPLIPKLKEELSLYSVNVPIDGITVIGFDRFKQALAWIKSLGLKVTLWPANENTYYENNNLQKLRGFLIS